MLIVLREKTRKLSELQAMLLCTGWYVFCTQSRGNNASLEGTLLPCCTAPCCWKTYFRLWQMHLLWFHSSIFVCSLLLSPYSNEPMFFLSITYVQCKEVKTLPSQTESLRQTPSHLPRISPVFIMAKKQFFVFRNFRIQPILTLWLMNRMETMYHLHMGLKITAPV